MMNTKKVIITTSIIGGIGVIAYSIYYYFTTQARLLQNFTYRILSVNLNEVTAQMVKGKVSINFSNNSDVEIAVSAFYLDFYLNGEYIGYLEDSNSFVIKSRQSTPITFDFTLNPQLVLGNLTNIAIFAVKAKDMAFSVRGNAKVKSGFIKATIPITYDTTIKEIFS